MTALNTDEKTERREASKFANLESRTWLTGQQRARYLGLSEGTENRYQKLGIGPRAIKIGNGSRSRRDWCDQWILEGGVTRPDRAAILRAANKATIARHNGEKHMRRDQNATTAAPGKEREGINQTDTARRRKSCRIPRVTNA